MAELASNYIATDVAFYFATIVVTISFILVVSLLVIFLIKYNHKKNPTPTQIEHNTKLEIIWTVIPTIIVMIMFYLGVESFVTMYDKPDKKALEIKVSGRMWAWIYEYPNGHVDPVSLKLPKDRPVRLTVTSTDVLHSFYVPEFRIKVDAVPQMNNKVWFTPTKEGTYKVYCTEYCGASHSYMLSDAEVMSQQKFDEWYQSRTEALARAE